MVNVLFLVFMLFAMSSRFTLQPGIAVSLPLSTFTLGPEQNPRVVSITAAPAPAVYFRDRRVTAEEFGERLGAAAGGERTLIIRADRGAPYELVMQITNEGLKRGYAVMLAAAPETSATR